MPENSDFDSIRRQYNYRCIICRQPEKVTGRLMQILVKGAGGEARIVPVCPEHRLKYSDGYFTNAELKKLGITREEYGKEISRAENDSESGKTEKAIQAQQETIKKVQKAGKKRFQQVHSDFRKEI